MLDCRDSGLKITEQARLAHNRNAEYTINDAWNKAHKAGTYDERRKLHLLGRRLAKARLSRKDIDTAIMVRDI